MMQIAIDGPASAGKSTIAKIIASRLGILFLDTGAMYRSLTLLALNEGIDVEAAGDHDFEKLFEKFTLNFEGNKVFLNGDDVTEAIREPRIDERVSLVSSFPNVREKLVAMQQAIASGRPVVMEGRDIGTVVLKDAPYKFFLDASVDVRAKRRHEQNIAKGIMASYESVKSQIEERDLNDKNKPTGQLKVAEGSLLIDTSDKSVEEIVCIIINSLA